MTGILKGLLIVPSNPLPTILIERQNKAHEGQSHISILSFGKEIEQDGPGKRSEHSQFLVALV
jgi:hypothetical protein